MANREKKATRVIDTLTGPLEKRYLPRMAAALPQWVTPDLLTLLGLVAAVLIAVGYVLTHLSPWWLALVNFALILHWYADSLDGTLARVRKIERERYGYFVDHVCDAVTAFLTCLGLGASPYMDMRVALFLAIGYLMMNIYVYIATYAKGEFKISFGKLGPTEVRILVFIINLIIPFWNPALYFFRGAPVRALDVGGILIGIIFLVMFAVCSIRVARELDRSDRAEKAQ